jgi:hypothetical protein
MDHNQRKCFIAQAACLVINAAVAASVTFATPLFEKTPYHHDTSALSGAAWVVELLNGHPERIHYELGVHKHVFQILISYLQIIGVSHSWDVLLEEQLAIFLYKCVTGLSIWHVGKRLQHLNDTIHKYVPSLWLEIYFNCDLPLDILWICYSFFHPNLSILTLSGCQKSMTPFPHISLTTRSFTHTLMVLLAQSMEHIWTALVQHSNVLLLMTAKGV